MHKNDDEYKRFVKLVKQFENLKARHNCGGGGIGQLLRVPSPPESRGAQILSKREFYNKFPFRLVRMSFYRCWTSIESQLDTWSQKKFFFAQNSAFSGEEMKIRSLITQFTIVLKHIWRSRREKLTRTSTHDLILLSLTKIEIKIGFSLNIIMAFRVELQKMRLFL